MNLRKFGAAADEKKPLFDIRLSGFLQTDFLWSDSKRNSSSAPRFAKSGANGDDQFSVTVQNSRFSLKLAGPKAGDGEIRGYAEMDLFNILNDSNVNNNLFRLQQLYYAVDQPTWSLLAGQTWDLFSPLNVGTLNTNGKRQHAHRRRQPQHRRRRNRHRHRRAGARSFTGVRPARAAGRSHPTGHKRPLGQGGAEHPRSHHDAVGCRVPHRRSLCGRGEDASPNLFFGLDDPDDQVLSGLPGNHDIRTRNRVWGLNLKHEL